LFCLASSTPTVSIQPDVSGGWEWPNKPGMYHKNSGHLTKKTRGPLREQRQTEDAASDCRELFLLLSTLTNAMKLLSGFYLVSSQWQQLRCLLSPRPSHPSEGLAKNYQALSVKKPGFPSTRNWGLHWDRRSVRKYIAVFHSHVEPREGPGKCYAFLGCH